MTRSRDTLTWLEPGEDIGESGWFEPGGRFRIGNVEFQCATSAHHSAPGHFSIRKNRVLVEEYLDVLDGFPEANVVELGIGDGGSVALAALLTEPKRLVAIELNPTRVDALDELVGDLGLSEYIRLHYGVNQADRVRLGTIVEDEFAAEPLDLVIDDASHSLEETRSSFETLFPRLRPEGLLLIEDWNHQHLLSRGIAEALARPDRPGLAEFERRLGEGPPEAPLSRLVVELILAQAESEEFLARVTVGPRWVGVRRGPGTLDHRGFRLSDLYTDHLGLLPGESAADLGG